MAVAATAEVNPLLHSQKNNKAPKTFGFRHQGDPPRFAERIPLGFP